MSDTPRTDKEIVGELLVFASFARKLERELAAANEERDELKSKYRTHHDEAERITNEIRRVSSVSRKLKQELAAITEQRDRLAVALRELCGTLLADNPRDITELLNKAGDALAAVKGGSDE